MPEAHGKDKLDREKTNEKVFRIVKEKRILMDAIRERR